MIRETHVVDRMYYLQMFGGFFIAGHQHKLGTDAPEMHVAQKSCTLYCGFICGLKTQHKTHKATKVQNQVN